MLSRRNFLGGSTSAAALLALSGCASEVTSESRQEQSRLREPAASNPGSLDLIRLATLAPSGHNTQPWRFSATDNAIRIDPDFTRRTSVVAPDDHHLFVSLGCAAENLLIAAAANGRSCGIGFGEASRDSIDIELVRGPLLATPLYAAIRENQCTRSKYDGQSVSLSHLRMLESASGIPGVTTVILTERKKLEEILYYVTLANDAQMDDAAFVGELRDWVRFNPSEALQKADGLFTRCSGQPVVPTWIGRSAFRSLYRKKAEDDRYAQQIGSSAGVAIFIGDKTDKNHWVKVGRSFQRFALQATALGIRHAMINQPVEVASVRKDFARFIGAGDMRPDLVVRFGYAAAMPMSMRRAVRSVLITQNSD